jgi:hypothetical protein
MGLRWWLAIQEFDYILIFIPGIENIIADALSRLYPNVIKLQPGETPDLDRSIIAPYPERKDDDIPTNKILAQTIATQDRLSYLTREIQQRIHIDSMSIPLTAFETGSFVLEHRREGSSPRLHTLWLGPMKVLRNTGSEYRLLSLITMKRKGLSCSTFETFSFQPSSDFSY